VSRASAPTLEAAVDSDTFPAVAEIAEVLKLNEQTIRNWILCDGATCQPLGSARSEKLSRSSIRVPR
jgi:hypothetical protein